MSNALLFSAEESVSSLSFDEMLPSQRTFFLIWELESELNNGGFLQYFSNSSGEHAPQVTDALIEIKAHHCSGIVEQAISIVPMGNEEWQDEVQRKRIIGNLSGEIKERLSALDTQFFSYPDNLSLLLAEFVEAHSQDFGV